MVAHYPVPIQEDIRDLLVDLLGRGAAVDKIDPITLGDDERGLMATYVTDEGDLGAVCICDTAFAVYVGAALVMVPVTVAKEQLGAEELDEQYLEYFQEIVNIMARLLNTPRTPHLRLDAVISLPAELPADVTALLASPEYRRDFVASIEGYGDGRVGILVN